MTLLDLCLNIDQIDSEHVIFAQRADSEFAPNSNATVLQIPSDEHGLSAQQIAAKHCPGFEYCLEVSIGKQAIQIWSHWRGGAQPNAQQSAEAVCYKANNDAWGPPNFPT
jgi:hypothetical protein